MKDAALESAWIWRWRKTDQPAAGAVQAAPSSNGDAFLATGNCGNARRSVQPVSIRKLARPLGFPLPADRRRRASRFRRSHVVAGREVMNTQVMREELPVAGDSLPWPSPTRKWICCKTSAEMDCATASAGFVSAGCQGPWRFGRRTPPGLDRSNGSLSELAADSLAALFLPIVK